MRLNTREIGIRKVLGSSAAGIILLLTKDFSLGILAANVLAWPAAFYAMNHWLAGFAYRVAPAPWTFVASAGLAYVLALLTVGLQSFKTAAANPADSLRHE